MLIHGFWQSRTEEGPLVESAVSRWLLESQ